MGYFFLRLGNVYGAAKMQSQWPDDQSLQMAKREHGKAIAKYSRNEIHEVFNALHKERQLGNEKFDWPNIDAIIGLISREREMTGSWGTGAHRLWRPEKLINQGTKENRDRAARKALAEMKEMFK